MHARARAPNRDTGCSSHHTEGTQADAGTRIAEKSREELKKNRDKGQQDPLGDGGSEGKRERNKRPEKEEKTTRQRQAMNQAKGKGTKEWKGKTRSHEAEQTGKETETRPEPANDTGMYLKRRIQEAETTAATCVRA